ncbi:hypothetical protein MTBBW1_80150 [Desulfamplus magnetovallimortis]|uniref:Condensation domain-containing protein n=1 Tax=Desulfamplus magnetovallimortis TaxID=1246637 RepID=L0R711_9BACT|nr:hypothetical protein [Desulfamplus magnetovallimortis]CCO06756.1 hypothetical protein DEMABW1_80150 [Desulfamplus magnetovallimortis BW-1]SLM32807.1 hypothetical protein MTBBW1_80150 [Desulfamplus magnetovallimortis]
MMAFDIIYSDDRTLLLFRFDHRMLDARGAEALLNLIFNMKVSANSCYNKDFCFSHGGAAVDGKNKCFFNGGGAAVDGKNKCFFNGDGVAVDGKNKCPDLSLLPFPVQGSQLHSWQSRFVSGRIINRFLRAVYPQNGKAASLPVGRKKPELNFVVVPFNMEETRQFDANTLKKAGYLMGGVYLLACAATVFDFFFSQLGDSGDMVVPVNIDTRGMKMASSEIFFNRISFLMFSIKRNLGKEKMISYIKQQFLQQIKEKNPHHFKNATLLMRILPIKVTGFFMNQIMKEKPYSFSFSYIGEQAFHQEHILGHKVKRLFHMPVVPIEPGIGIYFTRFNGKLNLVVSAFDNKAGKTVIDFLARAVKKEVLSGHGI